MNEPIAIQVILSAKTLTGTDLSNVFENCPGAVSASKKLKLGQFVTAKLTAPSNLLEITPQDTQPRMVGADDIVFIWYVKAVDAGQIPIDLAIFSQDDLKQNTAVQSFEVMHDNWTAQARGFPGLSYWIDKIKPIQDEIWLLASGTASLITFFGLKKFAARYNV